ncbi:MAG: GreA/GreB family elongation factor [Phycisphaerae bacterium]
MPSSQLLELAKSGNLERFEAACLESLGSGGMRLSELVAPFAQLEQLPQAQVARLGTLGQMVLENADAACDPLAALSIARVALVASPDSVELRKRVAELFKKAVGENPARDTILEASGLLTGRPPRAAMRVLDMALTVKVGSVYISRSEDAVIEITELALERGLVTFRRSGRTQTQPLAELARAYDPIHPDDFRVLRQLYPARLAELVSADPVRLVIGLIRAHGDVIDAEVLRDELVPATIGQKDWSGWWTKTRALLKKDPHVILEGRSPMMLRFTTAATTLEDETWAAFKSKKDPHDWLKVIEGYLREKSQNKETTDKAFLERCHRHIVDYVKKIESKRPAEALACTLVLEKLDAETGLNQAESKALAAHTLEAAKDPAALIAGLEDDSLWELALDVLATARQDAGVQAVRLIPRASAGLLDRLVESGLAAGQADAIQSHIEAALASPVALPEILYWMWKGPSAAQGLRIPSAAEQFTKILDTLSALGRTLNPPAEQMKRFRARMKSALGLRDYAAVKACLQAAPDARAITMRQQLDRLDGLGDNSRSRMLDLLREAHPALWYAAPRRQIPPWEDAGTVWTTKAGLDRKTMERDQHVNVTMRDNARRIGEAAEKGDLSENSEYKFALEERDLLRARLAKMNEDLSLARVIEPLDVPTEHVGIGSRVGLRRVADGAERVITFLGPFDADVDRGVYNYRAPMSLKLMGLTIGQRVALALDGGEAEFEISAISNGLLQPADA